MSLTLNADLRQSTQTGLQEAATLLRQNKTEAAYGILCDTIYEPHRAGQLTVGQYNAVYNIIKHDPHEPQTEFARRQFQPLLALKGRALNALVKHNEKEISPDVAKYILKAANILEETGDIEQAWNILHDVLPAALRDKLVTDQAVKEIYRLMNDSFRTPTSSFLQKLVKENPSAIDDNRLRARALESLSLHLFDDKVMNGETPKFAVSALPSAASSQQILSEVGTKEADKILPIRVWSSQILPQVGTNELASLSKTSKTLKQSVTDSIRFRKEATWKELQEWQKMGIALNKENLASLRVIRCEGDERILEALLETICIACPNLEVLDLGSDGALSDECFRIVGKYCHNLLSFSRSSTRSDLPFVKLETLTSGCPKLQHLNLGGCDLMHGVLAAISKHCPDLRSIDITPRYGRLSNKEVTAFIKSCKGLVHFAADGYGLEDEALRALAQCPQLTSVKLKGLRFSNAAVQEFVQSCRALTDLEINGNLNEEQLRTIEQARLPLKRLALSGILEQSEAIAALLVQYPQLTELSLRFCGVQEDVMRAIVENCHGLEKLDLTSNRELTPEAIKILAEGCPRLTDLSLKDNLGLDRTGLLQPLADSRCNITRIDFEGNHLATEEELIAFVRRNPGLTHVNFEGVINITDKVLIEISKNCPNLVELNIDPFRTRMEDSKFTWVGIKAIRQKCSKLVKFTTYLDSFIQRFN